MERICVARWAGRVLAGFVFFVLCGSFAVSSHAGCWIVLTKNDGQQLGQPQATMERSRTVVATEEAYYRVSYYYGWNDCTCDQENNPQEPGPIYQDCYGVGIFAQGYICEIMACIDGSWEVNDSWYHSKWGLMCYESFSGTWDVVCDEECEQDSHCPEGYACVAGSCVEESEDDPPVLGDGPFVAFGTWPRLSSSQESPTYFKTNRSLLWTFSDDYAACSELCTHTAEYQAVGDSAWTPLTVTTDPDGQWYAEVALPIDQLQNATTYAFRFAVTDCASQATESGIYYFRVATSDAPPVIESGPYLAAGSWPLLATSASRAFVVRQDSDVLWTFSDDYASCAGLCTHRARYKNVGDTAWTWIPASADPDGIWYAYATLPVESLDAGTYQFHYDVRDCAGQRTGAPRVYYFKVADPQ